MLRLIDTHAHLEQIENLETVLAGAKEAGITAIISVGCDIESNKRAIELAGISRDFIYPALGWHPWYIGEEEIDSSLQFISEQHGLRYEGVGQFRGGYLRS